jgi:hypothetical protein
MPVHVGGRVGSPRPPVHKARGARGRTSPRQPNAQPVKCEVYRAAEEQRRFRLFPLQTRALNKQVTNYNRAKMDTTEI